VSEEPQKVKFCPFRVEANLHRVSGVSEFDRELHCVRDRCMAWQDLFKCCDRILPEGRKL